MIKNTLHTNREGLKAARIIGNLIIGLSLIFLSSCENFLKGSDLADKLETAIDYANAPYATIQIFSDPDAKYTIVPSEGVYDKTYKAEDSIELDFTARSNFQFIKWVCEPEGAVVFDNERESKTTATIKKDDVKIKIQPKTEKRPVVAISPSGTEEKARNIAIVVSFDREMELNQEELKRIEITSGGEDLKKHYKTPEITNKTTVTFESDISNLVPVESTRTINVTVPEDFYSLADDGTKIYLEKEAESSFKINRNTLIKADIKIEKEADTCDLKGSSSNTYYIDDQIHLVCIPNEAYKITGWSITDDEENIIEDIESVLKIDVSEDKTEFTAKVLLGTEENKKIVIRPVCVLRNKLKVAFKSEVGTLTPATGTERTYYLGDSFTTTIKFPETHEFFGWKIYDKEQYEKDNLVEVLDAVEIEEKDEVLATTKTAVFTVIDDTKSVVILPDLSLKKTITISFKALKGNTTPSDSKTLYSGDSFDLRYSDISDYAFTNWKLYDKNNASRSVENLLEFDATRQETTVKVKKLTEDREVVLEVEFAKRPKVVSSTPSIVTGSVQRDRTIVVMFDKKMHPSSIYFNKDELIEAGVYDEDGTLNTKYETLGTAPDRIYGYYENGDKEGSSYVYKNIKITRNGNENINLLKYFDEPAFDKNNASTLRIPTKISEVDEHGKIRPDYDFAPPKNIGILVTLGTGMQYEVRENVFVGLYGENSWPYLTNQTTDAEPPEFVDIQIRTSDADADEISDVKADLTSYYYSENTEDSNVNRNVAITNSVENLRKFNVTTNCIWLKGSTRDTGSGTASLEAYFVKKHDPYYPNPNGQDIAIETPVFLELTEGSSTEVSDFNQMINLEELGLLEGVYTISFMASDANSHCTYSDCSYQFIYDVVAPAQIDNSTIRNIRESADQETIKWSDPDTSDFGKTIIEIYDGETFKKSYDVSKGISSQLFDELEDRKGYKYKLRSVDYSGNIGEPVEWEDTEGPADSSLIAKSTIKNIRSSADKETLSWTKPTAKENNYFIVEQYTPEGEFISRSELARSDSSKLFTGMSRGKYKYRFYSVDYANNISNSYTEWQDDVLPTATVTGISNYRTSKVDETISWTNPTGADFEEVDYMKIEQYDGTSLKNSYTWTPSSPATSKIFTGLTGGTKYTYKFSCVDYAGNKIAATTDWQDNERPTALVTKFTISGSRKAADNETVSWANPTGTGADEVSHIVIKQYYSITGTVLNDTFTQSDKTILSNNFTGLTDKRKYEYRFYSVDYNGNVSSNYTKYEDTTGPGKVTDVYGGGRKNSKVHLYFNTPDAEDFSHVEIYRKPDSGSSYTKENISVKQLDYAASALTVVNQKSKHYEVQPNSNAGTNTEYLIKAFDYAGNASEVTITQGYAQEGMVVYQHNKGTSKEEIFVSKNYYADKNPIGILYAINYNVYSPRSGKTPRYANLVYDIKEYSGNDYIWGYWDARPNYDDSWDHVDGLKDYNNFITNFKTYCVDFNKANYNKTGTKVTRDTVWKLLRDTINTNNTLTWYLPAIDDFYKICSNNQALKDGKKILTDNGVKVVLQGDPDIYLWGGNYLGTSSAKDTKTFYRIKQGVVESGKHDYMTSGSDKDVTGICNWHFITEISLD